MCITQIKLPLKVKKKMIKQYIEHRIQQIRTILLHTQKYFVHFTFEIDPIIITSSHERLPAIFTSFQKIYDIHGIAKEKPYELWEYGNKNFWNCHSDIIFDQLVELVSYWKRWIQKKRIC